MANCVFKNRIVKMTCAGLVLAVLSASCIMVPDNANMEINKPNVDCTGLIA